MATVLELVKRTEAILNRPLSKAAPERYLEDNLFRFIKDAYDVITAMLRKPIASDSSTTTVDGTAAYAIPTDCFGRISGIISVEYDGKPLIKTEIHTLQERYQEEWMEPEAITEVTYFLEYNDEDYILLVPPADDAVTLKYTYVQRIAQPTASTDTIPAFVEPYIPYIPDYIAGRILGNDKAGRGASLVAAFENRILQQVRRDKRNRTQRPGRESYSLALESYRNQYGGRKRTR